MTARSNFRTTCMTVAVAAGVLFGIADTSAFAQASMQMTQADFAGHKAVRLGVNKSMVIDLPSPAGDVLVSNPAIADAVLRTSRRLYLIGVKLGQANVFLFDGAGQQMASIDISVEADLSALNQLLAEAIPEGTARADAMNGNIVLRGQVPSASASARAQEITVGMLDGSSAGADAGGGGGGAAGATGGAAGGVDQKHVVNLLTIMGEEQVALKVTIAEVQRQVVKQLGINVSGIINNGGFSLGTLKAGLSPLSFGSGLGGASIGYNGSDGNVDATLQALQQTSMLKTLAEPTLAAVSGETANFLAGGEFPFVTGIDPTTGTKTVEFKPFGVQLAFTPVVLSGGRISLKVRTEVSEIASVEDGVPSINSRRAESTVELPSGGAFVLAGLIQDSMTRGVSGFPGLSKLPVLGALFSSKNFQSRQTELVMIVTPYLVKPVSPQALARPDQNLALSSDADSYFLGRLNKIYGVGNQPKAAGPQGRVGFSFD